MPKIIPIRELRDTTAMSEMCHNTEEPIFITKNGYGDIVIMSLETKERVNPKLLGIGSFLRISGAVRISRKCPAGTKRSGNEVSCACAR